MIVVAVANAAAAGPAVAQGPVQSESTMVWCYDEGRALVTRQASHACRGRVVDDDEARRIQQDRIGAMRRALQPTEPVVPGKRQVGTGSGFAVSGDGHVLTNNHVVDHCDAISVTPSEASASPATVVAADPALDLALLKTPLPGQGIASFRDGAELPPATDVAVVGYPSLGRVTIRPIMVPGIVYFGGRSPDPNRFMMKIAVHPGNSGGPVLDRSGQVIGVVVAMVNTPGVYAATGQAVSDVGFAIRNPVALKFLRDHGVAASVAGSVGTMTDAQLLDRGSRLVAQIGCWK